MCRRTNQIAIGLVLLLVGGMAQSHSSCEEESRVLPVEREVAAKIVKAVRKHAPDVKVTFKDEHQVRMEFLCQEYSVYHGGKGGPDDILSKDIGPTDRGFMVTLEWWKEAYNGQLGGGGLNQELREFYWSRHLNEFKLPKDRGFVRMDYSPGALTDPKIRADILAVLQKECGLEEKSDGDARLAKFLIDQLFDVLEPRLRTLIEKRHPEATVKRVGNELLVSYRIQEFVLHAVDANGRVAKDSHVEIGPMEDGFLIKIGGARASVRGQSLQLHGKASGPLWNRTWNSFAPERSGDREYVRYGVIRLETSYVAKAHHPLFREVEELLTEYGKPAIKGLYE